MITRYKKTTLAVCLILTIVCIVGVLPALGTAVLPEGLVIEETYTPGRGKPVAVVQIVLGDVVIMHEGVSRGYRAAQGIRLYKGDTVMTLEEGRVRFRMNDGSILSLAAQTKLKLTQSVYEKQKKTRSSFFKMALGKARFLVVKMLNFKRSEFKIKTPTAVCGVRGSDFILETTETETIATALADTELEFQSLAFLEDPPVILRDNESSSIRKGERPLNPIRLPLDKIEDKKGLFIGVAADMGAITDADAADQEGLDDDTGVDEVGDLGDKMSMEVVDPEKLGDRRQFDELARQIEPWAPSDIDTIKESVNEGKIGGELPDFPDLPQQ